MNDTIILPRSVVEQAISTIVELEYSSSTAVSDKMARDSKAALRAALEQPNHIAQHLNMVPEGWRLVPVEPTDSQIRAAQDTWWHACNSEMYWDQIYAAMLAAAPQPPVVEQPQVEQEPVAWRLFDGDPFPGTATRYVYYDKDDFKEGVNPTEHFQLEPLYTHPQPPRQPLTDEQIRAAMTRDKIPYAANIDHYVAFARAIERAHGIGGEA